mmetsp:Transcript_11336/g.26280  ORF Transcript_11336/g.26280 Transcript_11336/m.26280 type:complete len:209 (+) Transcript_11336:1431-2057(+)
MPWMPSLSTSPTVCGVSLLWVCLQSQTACCWPTALTCTSAGSTTARMPTCCWCKSVPFSGLLDGSPPLWFPSSLSFGPLDSSVLIPSRRKSALISRTIVVPPTTSPDPNKRTSRNSWKFVPPSTERWRFPRRLLMLPTPQAKRKWHKKSANTTFSRKKKCKCLVDSCPRLFYVVYGPFPFDKCLREHTRSQCAKRYGTWASGAARDRV